MPATHQPLFERLTRLLDPLNPAELHGLLCGLLCADPDLDRDRWLRHTRELQADDGEFSELSQPVRDPLAKLHEYGLAQMNAHDWSVTLLLPDDDAPLPQRVDALGAWCQGLLYGLGVGQVERRGVLSGESREFLRDVAEIAQAGFNTDRAGEADETAYAEVVEYLRVGLLMIQQDIQQSTAPSPARPR